MVQHDPGSGGAGNVFDQRFVDLYNVQGEAGQTAEVGVSGAVIVDQYPDPLLGQGGEGTVDTLGQGAESGLGQFHADKAGRQVIFPDAFQNPLGNVRLGAVHGGKVYIHPADAVFLNPRGAQKGADGFQHELGHFQNGAVLLGDGNEFPGGNLSQGFAVHPQQRFRGAKPAAAGAVDGLVHNVQRAVFHSGLDDLFDLLIPAKLGNIPVAQAGEAGIFTAGSLGGNVQQGHELGKGGGVPGTAQNSAFELHPGGSGIFGLPGYAGFFQLIQHCLHISAIPKTLGYKAEAAVFHPGKQAPGICPQIVGKGLNPLLQNVKAQNLFQSIIVIQDHESYLKILSVGQRRNQKVGKTGFIQNPCGAVHDLFRILYRQLGNHQTAGAYEVLNDQVGKEKLNENGGDHKHQKQVNGELLQPGNQGPVANQGVDDGKEIEAG